MKIGILTFHDGINFGAFLQCYSLQEKIKELGYEVEVIHYKNRWYWIKELLYVIQKDLTIRQNLIKIIKFFKVHKKFNLSHFSGSISKFNGRYDAIVFGSDEVWNINNPAFGYDLSYFGKGLDQSKLIAYAPSFGSTKHDDPKLNMLIPFLSKFHRISVRDINSHNIVTSLINHQPEIVPDPTFLIDQAKWLKPPKERDYIVIYAMVLSKEQIDFILDYSKKVNMQIISVGYKWNFAKKNVIGIDPFELLGYLNNSSYVFTSMFHGTIFSILLNCDFTIFMDPYRRQKFSKLLNVFKLEDRIFKKGYEINPVDYSYFKQQKSEFQSIGEQYLKDAILTAKEGD